MRNWHRSSLPRHRWRGSQGVIGFSLSAGTEEPEPRDRDALAAEFDMLIAEACEACTPYSWRDLAAATALTFAGFDPETWRESDDPYLPAAAELVELLIASAHPTGTSIAGLAETVRGMLALFRRTSELYLEAVEESDDWQRFGMPLRSRFLRQATFVRGTSFSHQSERHLRDLFAEPQVAALTEAAAGFDAADGLRCIYAIQRMFEAKASPRLADVESKAALTDDHVALGNAVAFDAVTLSREAGVSLKATCAFLDALSLRVGTVGRPTLLSGTHAARRRPLLTDGERYVVTVLDNILRGMRVTLEDALKTAGSFNRYALERGRYVEREAMAHLCRFIRPDFAIANVVAERSAAERELEIDGLLLVDRTALVVEAKAGGLRALSDLTDPQKLRQNMDELVVRAVRQTGRARTALLNGVPLIRADRTEVELPADRIERVYSIAVSLEDVSFAAFGLDALAERTPWAPWIVSLDQLETACAALEWPAQLFDFLARREAVQAAGRVYAADEFDMLMQYLSHLLAYDQLLAEHDFLYVTSQTDHLTSWIYYKHGLRKRSTPRPQQDFRPDLRPATRSELRRLDAERPRDWLARSAGLIEAAMTPTSPSRGPWAIER